MDCIMSDWPARTWQASTEQVLKLLIIICSSLNRSGHHVVFWIVVLKTVLFPSNRADHTLHYPRTTKAGSDGMQEWCVVLGCCCCCFLLFLFFGVVYFTLIVVVVVVFYANSVLKAWLTKQWALYLRTSTGERLTKTALPRPPPPLYLLNCWLLLWTFTWVIAVVYSMAPLRTQLPELPAVLLAIRRVK